MTDIKPWQSQQTRLLADCRIFTVHETMSTSPETNETHSFFYLDTTDWVNIVPVTSNNEVVLIRQYRHGSDEITLEIPGGMVDPGEAPDVAATRECLEESGYLAASVSSLGTLSPNPAFLRNTLFTYIARDVEKTAAISNTSTEHTEVELVHLDDLPELLVSGKIDHALVVATLWRALYYLRNERRVTAE